MKTSTNQSSRIAIAAIVLALFTVVSGYSQETSSENELVNSHLVAAYNYQNVGELDSALIAINIVIKAEPTNFKAYDLRGIIYTKQIKYHRALHDFNKVIDLNPNFTEAYNHRGIVYFCMQEFQNATNDYTKALELDPHYAKVYYNRGIVKLVLEDESGAIADIQAAANLQFSDAVNYLASNNIH